MKKKVIIGLTTVILLAATSTAIYADYLNEEKTVEQNLKQLATASLNIEDDFYSDPMFDWLYSQYTDQEKREYLIEEYAYIKFFHNMTDEEASYLFRLTQKGQDFYELLRVYAFWKTTTEPMEIIEVIYAKCPDDPKIGWEYEEYMNLIGKKDEILTDNEIEDYLENGLTEYDIIYAQHLSRKNIYSTRDILNQRKNKAKWVDVSDTVYTKVDKHHAKKIKKGLFQNKNVSGRQMYLAENLSNKIGGDVSDYLGQNNLEYIKENYENNAIAKIRTELINKGYVEESDDMTAQYKETYIDKLTSMELTEKEIAEYQEAGWDYTSIYNAKLISTRKNIRMESVFSQMKDGIALSEIK